MPRKRLLGVSGGARVAALQIELKARAQQISCARLERALRKNDDPKFVESKPMTRLRTAALHRVYGRGKRDPC